MKEVYEYKTQRIEEGDRISYLLECEQEVLARISAVSNGQGGFRYIRESKGNLFIYDPILSDFKENQDLPEVVLQSLSRDFCISDFQERLEEKNKGCRRCH